MDRQDIINQEIEMPIFEANSSFAKQVDAVLSGADMISTHLKVMGTPFILRQLGAKNLPILLPAGKLKNIAKMSETNPHYHGINVDTIKKLPELVSDPVMLMDSISIDSKTQKHYNDRVVIVTSEVNKENAPIIVAVKFDGKGYLNGIEIDTNIIVSLYGKDGFTNFIKNNIAAKSVLYWNKEKSQELNKIPGVQFPDNLDNLAPNVIIRKAKAFVNSDTKKTSQELNEIPGVQFPDSLNILATDSIIHEEKTFVNKEIKNESQEMSVNPKLQLPDIMTNPDSKSIIDKKDSSVNSDIKEKTTASDEAAPKKTSREQINESRAEIVKELVAKMQSGELKWEHFAAVSLPRNGVSEKPYSGVNRFRLSFEAVVRGYKDPRWYTFNQVNEMGLKIEKGQRGVKTELYKLWDKKRKVEIKSHKELDQVFEGMSEEEIKLYRAENLYTLARQSVVFNGEQVAGLEKYVAPQLSEVDKNVKCEQLLQNAPCAIEYGEETIAFYEVNKDFIYLPDRGKFNDIKALYATAFHEIGHSTGHESRLGRDMSGIFGSEKYASEELIAELCSVFIQQDLGVAVGSKEIENHAAYLQSWLKNPEDFYVAVKAAERGSEYINKYLEEKVKNSEEAKRQRIIKYYQDKRKKNLDRLEKNIPAELKSLRQWCAFKAYTQADGSKKKFNIDVNPGDNQGHWAKVNDESTWSTFDEAMKYAREKDCEGVTFVITKKSGVKVIDLDKCIDVKTGEALDVAKKFLEATSNTYQERSVSGSGAHIFFKGDSLGAFNNRDKDGHVEYYSDVKFISMTGNVEGVAVCDTLAEYGADSELALALAGSVGKKLETASRSATRSISSLSLSDREVIEMLEKSKVGAEFSQLMAGMDICGDHSRSDYRLASMLAFATGNDKAQIETIFRSSGLYRQEKGDKYVSRTVDAAIQNNRGTYNREFNKKYGSKKKKTAGGAVKS